MIIIVASFSKIKLVLALLEKDVLG